MQAAADASIPGGHEPVGRIFDERLSEKATASVAHRGIHLLVLPEAQLFQRPRSRKASLDRDIETPRLTVNRPAGRIAQQRTLRTGAGKIREIVNGGLSLTPSVLSPKSSAARPRTYSSVNHHPH